MSLPKYTKITKNGVTYESGADRCEYSIHELSRAALRDVGKFVCKLARPKIPKITGNARKNLQYWVKSKTPRPMLQVGYKRDGFYAGFFETGTKRIKKISPIYGTIADNIDEIQKIEGQYLSAISSDEKTENLIDESEEISDD